MRATCWSLILEAPRASGLVAAFLACGLLAGAAHAQDLQIASARVPFSGSTSHAGASFSARTVIENPGLVAITPDFHVHYYYCSTLASTTCEKLADQQVKDDFAAGQARSYTRALVVPNTARYGLGYLRILVDATDVIPERNENNNGRYEPISVTTRPALSLIHADFPYTGSTSAPGAVFTGQIRLSNAAKTSRLMGGFKVHYNYCPEDTHAVGCVTLGSQQIKDGIDADSYSSFFLTPGLTIPKSAREGTRYLRGWVDSTETGAVEAKPGMPQKPAPEPPRLTAEQRKQRIAASAKAAEKKRSLRPKDTGGLSGFLAHWLWLGYQLIPPLGGWDWLVFIVVLCVVGRILSLPFLWKIASHEWNRWFLLAINTITLWLWAWFFQTDAGAALLGVRVGFDGLSLADTNRGLYWITLMFCLTAVAVGAAIAKHDDDWGLEQRVATAHMEAGVLVLAHLFYWYWSVTSLVVFITCLITTILLEIGHALSLRLISWRRGEG